MFRLTEEQQSTVDMVRKLVERGIAPRAAELDRQHAFPEHARDLFAQLGLLNPLLPAEYDGPGLGMMTMALVLEGVAQGLRLHRPAVHRPGRRHAAILHGGSPELKRKVLGRLGGDSRLLTALAATEPTAPE